MKWKGQTNRPCEVGEEVNNSATNNKGEGREHKEKVKAAVCNFQGRFSWEEQALQSSSSDSTGSVAMKTPLSIVQTMCGDYFPIALKCMCDNTASNHLL